MLAFDLYRYWETDLRPFTVNALRRMTPYQLLWTPDGYQSCAFDLAEQMVEGEWTWIHRNLLKRSSWGERWERGRFENLDHLLSYWSDIHRASVEWLKDTPVSELNKQVPTPSIGMPWVTMSWVISHVIEHEAHHRGQIFLLMSLQGVAPPEL